MEIPLFVQIIIVLFLIIFSGFFSGSETALFSLSLIQRERFKKQGTKRTDLIARLLANPRQLIATILIGNDMVNITSSVIAAHFFIILLGSEYGKWTAIAVMTPITLIFAEIIPKTLFFVHNERLAPFVSLPISVFSKLITPLRFLFDKVGDVVIMMFGVEKSTLDTTIMEDDFLDMVNLSHADGEINISERDLIHNVFEFSDTRVFEVMTPLQEIYSLPHDMGTMEIIGSVKENLYSRVPIYQNSQDNIVGILYAKDLLRIDLQKTKPAAQLLPLIWRKPYYIRDDEKIDTLFYVLKKKRIHMAICLDKNEKVSGLITMEDLLEELFGEIYDEHEQEDV